MGMKKDILASLDVCFAVGGEMRPDHGEDSMGYAFNENGGALAVFDGCGGLGARRYEEFGARTGAYIASKAARDAVLRCWHPAFTGQNGRVNEEAMAGIKADLYQSLTAALNKYKPSSISHIKGSLARELPTTMSVILCDYDRGKGALSLAFILAGDTRGYILTGDGLAQVTRDDVAGELDAYENLTSDARLENVVAADGDFRLNHKLLFVPEPFVAVAATDGSFGCWSTPMEFEYLLLGTLVRSKNVAEWKVRLEDEIGKAAGDDFSLSVAAFGHAEFNSLCARYAAREKHLRESCISKLKDAGPEQTASLWVEYRKNYYRW